MLQYDASIITQLKEKQLLYKFKKDQLEKTLKEKEELEATIQDERNELQSLDKMLAACKLIIEQLTIGSKIKLEEFLTTALQQIFVDHKYEIQLVLKEDTKKPGLELTLVENGEGQEITDAVGGGVVSTLGLLLQIYYIEAYGLNKVLFIDEGLKEVSTGTMTQASENMQVEQINYLENILKFLKWLSNERLYTFVIVTHDNQVRAFADRIYEVSNGEVKLC